MLALLSNCYLGSISLLSEFGFRSRKKMKDNLAEAWFVPFDFLFFIFTVLDDSFSYFNFNSNDVFKICLFDLSYILQALARLGPGTRTVISHCLISTSSRCGSLS